MTLSFNEKLVNREFIVGTFIQTGHPVMTEYMAKLGFDFVLLECEHSVMSEETVQTMVQTLSSSRTNCLVRIPGVDPLLISRYLDMGVDGIVIPQIRTINQLEAIKQAALYPPNGTRGIGPARMYDYGYSLSMDATDSKHLPSISIQIETKEALELVEDIAAYDLIDSLFIGPSDLSLNLGVFGQFNHPLMTEAIEKIINVARSYNKSVGIFAGTKEMASTWLKAGVDYVVLSSDLGMIQETASSYFKEIKKVKGE